jgi:hypothetical protein
LQNSHVIPAFVIRYLKDTSATGHLRAPGSSGRIQDLPTPDLLCSPCEQIFARFEREFSLRAFPKIQSDDFQGFEYGEWLLKFAVSLAWRVLTVDARDVAELTPKWTAKIGATLEAWRKYLLGLQNSPHTIHHLFVFPGLPDEVPDDSHPKSLHYYLRAVDATVLDGRNNLGVYCKLLRSIFYSPIVPAKPSGWSGTQIYAGGGTLILSHQSLTSSQFGGFLQSRVRLGFNQSLSEKAIAQITKSIKKNPQRAAESETFTVHEVSKELWEAE